MRRTILHLFAEAMSHLFFFSRPFRAAVAASDAFFARATRSSGVMVSRERFPPIFPPFAPCLRKKSRISGGSRFFATFRS